jgi:hypothetical protein
VNFWLNTQPEGVPGRNANFVVSHSIFCTFNVLNLIYLILFEALTFRRLGKNHLLKLAFLACFFQMNSCFTSIHRYNIDDEYGLYAKIGVVTGLAAYVPFNTTYLHLIFQRNTKAIRAGIYFWIVVVIAIGYISLTNWETVRFSYFRTFIGISTVFHVVALIIGHRSFKHGSIAIDESIVSKETMLRMFKVLIGLDTISLVASALLGKPILTYPGTGCTYTVMVIAMSFVGRMDFMTSEGLSNSDLVGTERQPLNTV